MSVRQCVGDADATGKHANIASHHEVMQIRWDLEILRVSAAEGEASVERAGRSAGLRRPSIRMIISDRTIVAAISPISAIVLAGVGMHDGSHHVYHLLCRVWNITRQKSSETVIY